VERMAVPNATLTLCFFAIAYARSVSAETIICLARLAPVCGFASSLPRKGWSDHLIGSDWLQPFRVPGDVPLK
jgi:hypothetical protein